MLSRLFDGDPRFSFLLFVQRTRSFVILRRTLALGALLAAFFVEPQGEALSKFLQDALLLALSARTCSVLAAGSGHDTATQVRGLLLKTRMRDQGNRRFRQRMLGCYVAGRTPVLFVSWPLPTVQTTQRHVIADISFVAQERSDGSFIFENEAEGSEKGGTFRKQEFLGVQGYLDFLTAGFVFGSTECVYHTLEALDLNKHCDKIWIPGEDSRGWLLDMLKFNITLESR